MPEFPFLLSGFTFVRNALKFDYPFLESINSLLPLVDELVINVGDSEDGTEKLVKQLKSPKIKLFFNAWRKLSPIERKNGIILSEQTNLALQKIQGAWGLYLQADEVLHEKEYDYIRQTITNAKKKTDAIRFPYLHFKGDYHTINPWAYKKEIRLVRNHRNIYSFGDACSFKKNDGKKIQLEECKAHIFHYGWVKNPATMVKKQKNLDYFYHSNDWLKEKYHQKEIEKTIFEDVKICRAYHGSHPKTMQKKIAAFPPLKRKRSRWSYLELYKKLFKYGWV